MKLTETDHEGGDNLSQAQSEYIELLEEKLMEQANEILRLKRKLMQFEKLELITNPYTHSLGTGERLRK